MFWLNDQVNNQPYQAEYFSFSHLQTPRQQMSQFWSEDFAAHILQISSFRTAEDLVSDLILCVRCTYFDAILDTSYVLGLVSFFFRGVHNLIQHDAGQQQEADLLLSCYHFTCAIPAAMLFLQRRARQQQQRYNRKRRPPSLFEQRLVWDTFCRRHSGRSDFTRHIRMSHDSFNKLLSAIQQDLEVDREMADLGGGAILPEICLYVCLRYLAGGSYSDIKYITGISSASFYRVLWKTMRAINQSKSEILSIKFPATTAEAPDAAMGFQSVSQGSCIWNCVAGVDGYHLQIQTPSKAEAKNVKSFFLGHYQTYGVNVQAACDSNCRFSFLGIAGPGVMGDREAIDQKKNWNSILRIAALLMIGSSLPTRLNITLELGNVNRSSFIGSIGGATSRNVLCHRRLRIYSIGTPCAHLLWCECLGAEERQF